MGFANSRTKTVAARSTKLVTTRVVVKVKPPCCQLRDRCAIKHIGHIRHFGYVPFVERLVEGFCVIKHTMNYWLPDPVQWPRRASRARNPTFYRLKERHRSSTRGTGGLSISRAVSSARPRPARNARISCPPSFARRGCISCALGSQDGVGK